MDILDYPVKTYPNIREGYLPHGKASSVTGSDYDGTLHVLELEDHVGLVNQYGILELASFGLTVDNPFETRDGYWHGVDATLTLSGVLYDHGPKPVYRIECGMILPTRSRPTVELYYPNVRHKKDGWPYSFEGSLATMRFYLKRLLTTFRDFERMLKADPTLADDGGELSSYHLNMAYADLASHLTYSDTSNPNALAIKQLLDRLG